jgi:tRNA threonylcarbamoyladenosine biosynthesis protein TsaE
MSVVEVKLADASATERLGNALAKVLNHEGAVLYLRGELGTGKTTLARALLQTLGHDGRVRSPTYTLVEPYDIGGRQVFHLDLYRLSGAEELEYLGLRDLDPERDLILIEWPERGQGGLPPADIEILLDYQRDGRHASLKALSRRGNTILSGFQTIDHFI